MITWEKEREAILQHKEILINDRSAAYNTQCDNAEYRYDSMIELAWIRTEYEIYIQKNTLQDTDSNWKKFVNRVYKRKKLWNAIRQSFNDNVVTDCFADMINSL